ncbi:oxygen-independent coproporphyrinogen III oxidase [Litorisediminicola beolgyonensis]|uniref:Coproporphyrinogen-III oxidase n=1 Tax=Litorisediminicola beolgyonensis TaxID=1173614 RepID=A0ABW3ZHB6_9RHOB
MRQNALRSALLTERVPRYTSYPPANRFTAAVGPELSAQWMEALPPGSEISLYAHVPFCRRLCWFCACRTQGTSSLAPLDRYLDTLEIEIDALRGRLPSDLHVSSLHLGGGTPTLLPADRIDRLSEMLRRAFAIDHRTEVSVEIDPTECDERRIEALLRLGLTRASIGVQDFDPMVQDAIGRRQDEEETASVVRALRARFVDSVNLDLLYGLPYQTLPRLRRTLDAVLRLRPDRIALYGYAHVPWMAKRQTLISESALPSPEDRLALSAFAAERLQEAGYTAIGIDHFALPSDSMARAARERRLKRNFQGYTTDRAPVLIALGPSSISRYPQGFAQNASSTAEWQKAVAEGRPATRRGYALTEADQAVSRIVEDLMCYGETDLATIPDPGMRGEMRLRAADAILALPELATLEGDHLKLLDPRLARLLAARLDPDLQTGERQFSQAS